MTVIEFNEEYFFYFLLPPIIFASGYNLRTKKFVKYLPYTGLFGVLSTLVNFAATAGLTYLFSELGCFWTSNLSGTYLILRWIIHNCYCSEEISLSAKEILIFSATVCSSDAVAAVTMIKYKEHPKLYSVIVGEGISFFTSQPSQNTIGLTNDAVSIILTQSVIKLFDNQSSNIIHGI